jgi:hypothetical protein
MPDVFWLDRYGHISWENEKARLDNFAIQLMNQPNTIGYLYVQAGSVSCKGEAQAQGMCPASRKPSAAIVRSQRVGRCRPAARACACMPDTS